jgi:hypothetical protein
MHFVQQASMKPNRCAAYPGLGPRHEKGYVLLGFLPGFDNDAIVSVEALQNIARNIPQAGLALDSDVAALRAELEQARAENADLTARLDRAEQTIDKTEFLVSKESAKQYEIRRRMGRPSDKAKAGKA